MKRRAFLAIVPATILVGIVPAVQARADSFVDGIVAQLTRQGFEGISTETTWLGRSRIVGSRADGQREIIVNPRTGEILRDLWTSADGVQSPYPILDDVGGTTSPGGADEGTSGGTSGGTDSGSGSNGSGSGSGAGSGSGSGDSGGDSGGDSESGDSEGGKK